jgi:hypothetical protein
MADTEVARTCVRSAGPPPVKINAVEITQRQIIERMVLVR